MAHNQEGLRIPAVAASAIAQYVPVQFLQAGSALSETVIRNGSWNVFSPGFTEATIATYGIEVAVKVSGVVKGVAGASLGAGCLVAVGSTNGVLAPITPSGGPASANLVSIQYSVGVALKNAAAGDYFPVLIKPDQVS